MDGDRPRFEVREQRQPTGDVLVCGFSEFGFAGLTAVDYLVDQTDLEQCGHLAAVDLPTITPFENGTPRHPIRLYDTPAFPATVLVSEVAVPPFAGPAFGEALLEWTAAADIEEVVVPAGVPIAHGPDEHRTFHVASEDYQAHRLEGEAVPPMGGGYLDGTKATLLTEGMDTSLRVCVFATPVHAQAPDVDAAIRLVETLTAVYDLDLDIGPLESFAADVQRHYQDLADRLDRTDEESPEDRMYM